MNTYRLTRLDLEKPITIVAENHDQASEMIVIALRNAFGQFPEVFYIIDEWLPPTSPEKEMLQGLADLGDAGFVQKYERFWEVLHPNDIGGW